MSIRIKKRKIDFACQKAAKQGCEDEVKVIIFELPKQNPLKTDHEWPIYLMRLNLLKNRAVVVVISDFKSTPIMNALSGRIAERMDLRGDSVDKNTT